MRAILLCLAAAGALVTAGCVNKGPYYIYGDYIENHGGEGYDYGDEYDYPPEEISPEEGLDNGPDPANPGPAAAGAKKII